MVTLKGKQNAETAGVVPDSPTEAGGSRGQVPLSSTSLGDQKFPKAICSHSFSALNSFPPPPPIGRLSACSTGAQLIPTSSLSPFCFCRSPYLQLSDYFCQRVR